MLIFIEPTEVSLDKEREDDEKIGRCITYGRALDVYV